MTKLKALRHRLEAAGLLVRKTGPFKRVYIDHLACDSRKVGPNSLFVAIKGEQADGHLFIDKAVKNGAIAIVCEAMPADVKQRYAGIAFAQVNNARAAWAILSAAYYGDPAQDMTMIGVTGTNGKTTTAYLIHTLLEALGQPAGLIGTIAYRYGTHTTPATHTTPDAHHLHQLLHEMQQAACTSCVMEVSSHALTQDRVTDIPFSVGIFTNLTRDHLDYHGSFKAYLAAKKQLFDGLTTTASAIVNGDDAAAEAIVADTKGQVITYGQSEGHTIPFEVLANTMHGLRLRLDGAIRNFRLVGQFNAYNLAAAYSVGRTLGHSQGLVLDALAEAAPVPGRFEQMTGKGGRIVIIDYAHTPDALENVLQTIRVMKTESATLWCVFGCGGDRDATKRRIMGALAEQYADQVIVTSDNPRTEDPAAILNEIRRGMNRPTEAIWEVDRRTAIQLAATLSRPGDIVLIAGKGHEPYQVIGTEYIHFDDREEARKHFTAS